MPGTRFAATNLLSSSSTAFSGLLGTTDCSANSLNHGRVRGCLFLMLAIFWLALCLAGFQVRGTPRPDADPKGSIQGVVVRAGASALGARAELADALVELKPGNAKVMTRADGTFTFRNLAPG